jgi:hypothetical protein
VRRSARREEWGTAAADGRGGVSNLAMTFCVSHVLSRCVVFLCCT